VKIHMVEQRSAEWGQLRCGIPTASEFGRLVTSKGEPSKSAADYAIDLAGEKYSGKPELDAWEGNSYTDRGTELEDKAIALYEFNQDATVNRVGFVTDDAEEIGCSPDGLVGEDGMIEIKARRGRNHIKAILYHRKHGRCPPDYVQQTQGQMMICARAWCDLVFYHPKLPLLIIRQTPDEKLQAALTEQLTLVCRERDSILKEIQ